MEAPADVAEPGEESGNGAGSETGMESARLASEMVAGCPQVVLPHVILTALLGGSLRQNICSIYRSSTSAFEVVCCARSKFELTI